MHGEIRLPTLKFNIPILDQDSGQRLLQVTPKRMEQIHWGLTQDGWQVDQITVSNAGEWTLQISSEDVKHQLIFSQEFIQMVVSDLQVFDKIHQIVEQLARLRLVHKFLKLRKGLQTNDDNDNDNSHPFASRSDRGNSAH